MGIRHRLRCNEADCRTYRRRHDYRRHSRPHILLRQVANRIGLRAEPLFAQRSRLHHHEENGHQNGGLLPTA